MVEGIVRNLDQLGRITLPKETRRAIGIKEGNPMEIWVEDGVFHIKPVRLRCVCCGEPEGKKKLIEQNGVLVCTDCIEQMKEKIAE